MKTALLIVAVALGFFPLFGAVEPVDDGRLLYKDVYVDGPQYTAVELWNLIGHRSPYTAYFGVATGSHARVMVTGLNKIQTLITLTREALEKSSGVVLRVVIKGNSIQFVRRDGPAGLDEQAPDATVVHETKQSDAGRKKNARPVDLDVQVLGLQPARNLRHEERMDAHAEQDGHASSNSWDRILAGEGGAGRHFYPGFRLSGLQGLGFVPSLRGMRGVDGGTVTYELDSSYATEKYSGSDGAYLYKVSGGYYKEHLRLHHWLTAQSELSAEVSAGVHDSSMSLGRLPATPLMRVKNLKFNAADLVLSARHLLLQRDGYTLIPGVDIKLPLSGRTDVVTSGHADTALSLEMLKENGQTDLVAKVGYVAMGDLDVFRPGAREWNQHGIVTGSAGVGQTLTKVDSVSVAFNYAQNPLRGLTKIQSLSGDIATFGALYRRPFHDKLNGQIEAATGLTQAAPDLSVALGLSTSF